MASDETAARTLDAQDIDGEPFGDIMAALDSLDPGERLVLVNSFEPQPLYGVLEERGFDHEAEQVADNEWHVEIRHAE
jgi:uncharacterized protein (DUF2249 family)